jgi:hypothetical protein
VRQAFWRLKRAKARCKSVVNLRALSAFDK